MPGARDGRITGRSRSSSCSRFCRRGSGREGRAAVYRAGDQGRGSAAYEFTEMLAARRGGMDSRAVQRVPGREESPAP